MILLLGFVFLLSIVLYAVLFKMKPIKRLVISLSFFFVVTLTLYIYITQFLRDM